MIYVSSEVIMYSFNDLMRMTGLGRNTLEKFFDDPKFPSIDYGIGRLAENHALMEYFSVRRFRETGTYTVRIDRDPWEDDFYDSYYSFLREDYRKRCKRVDELRLDWMDAEAEYASPEVVFLSREDILERSSWTEEEVMMLFADLRFPMTKVRQREIVEVHALIQFFERKNLVRQKQMAAHEQREERFAHLRRERSGR